MNEATKTLIREKFEEILTESKNSVKDIKEFAIGEVWNILQLLTATIIQIIENIGKDLSSPEKKQLAMEMIEKFYNEIFIVVQIPYIPDFVLPLLKKYIQQMIMIFASSAIDAMVTTFRQVGVFKPKDIKSGFMQVQADPLTNTIVILDLIENLKTIVRKK